MESIIESVQKKYRKHEVVKARSGDSVRVSQRIKEGSKARTQVFEGLVIRTRRVNDLTATITVRRIASGPLIEKIEVVKRSKVRRNYLSYMRERGGKSARLEAIDFDKEKVNTVSEAPVEEVKEEPKAEAAAEAPKSEEVAGSEAKAEEETPAADAEDVKVEQPKDSEPEETKAA